jgi:hypothetical protein
MLDKASPSISCSASIDVASFWLEFFTLLVFSTFRSAAFRFVISFTSSGDNINWGILPEI